MLPILLLLLILISIYNPQCPPPFLCHNFRFSLGVGSVTWGDSRGDGEVGTRADAKGIISGDAGDDAGVDARADAGGDTRSEAGADAGGEGGYSGSCVSKKVVKKL